MLADITGIFWGSPLIFWCCVGIWGVLLLVVLLAWLLSLGNEGGEGGKE